MRLIWSLSLAALLASGCSAPQPLVVQVDVVDADTSEPLEGADVIMDTHIAASDTDGRLFFELDEKPEDAVTVTARADGYEPYEREHEFEAERSTSLEIRMEIVE